MAITTDNTTSNLQYIGATPQSVVTRGDTLVSTVSTPVFVTSKTTGKVRIVITNRPRRQTEAGGSTSK